MVNLSKLRVLSCKFSNYDGHSDRRCLASFRIKPLLILSDDRLVLRRPSGGYDDHRLLHSKTIVPYPA